MILAEAATLTLGQLITVISISVGILVTLIGWLHLRIGGIEKRADRKNHETNDRIAKIYEHLGEFYVQKDTINVRFDSVLAAIKNVATSTDRNYTILSNISKHLAKQDERITRIEATCEAYKDKIPYNKTQ